MKYDITGPPVGYGYIITYTENVGDMPGLIVEFSGLSSQSGTTNYELFDGDNSLNAANLHRKTSRAVIGETPAGYNAVEVDKDDTSFTITGLNPGKTYYASVSAINGVGIGSRMNSVPNSFTPPKQAPQPPTNVEINVNPGSTTNLQVSFDSPDSDGGTDILSYRIELDTTNEFPAPLFNTLSCPAASIPTVWQIALKSSDSTNPIKSGAFKLSISARGVDETTNYIPFDAVSTIAEEVGIEMPIAVTPKISDSPSEFHSERELVSLNALIFPGNRIKFTRQKNDYDVFTVLSTESHIDGSLKSMFTVDRVVEWADDFNNATGTVVSMVRVYGGRGGRIACQSQ
jgi:hypothetical protein